MRGRLPGMRAGDHPRLTTVFWTGLSKDSADAMELDAEKTKAIKKSASHIRFLRSMSDIVVLMHPAGAEARIIPLTSLARLKPCPCYKSHRRSAPDSCLDWPWFVDPGCPSARH